MKYTIVTSVGLVSKSSIGLFLFILLLSVNVIFF